MNTKYSNSNTKLNGIKKQLAKANLFIELNQFQDALSTYWNQQFEIDEVISKENSEYLRFYTKLWQLSVAVGDFEKLFKIS